MTAIPFETYPFHGRTAGKTKPLVVGTNRRGPSKLCASAEAHVSTSVGYGTYLIQGNISEWGLVSTKSYPVWDKSACIDLFDQ